jgi:osmotically-inducible protein OsmY
VLLAIAASGCRPTDEVERRDRPESETENLEEAGRELGDDLAEASRDLGEGLAEAGRDVGEGLGEAGRAAAEGAEELGARVEPHLRDAALTAAVKARLAADPEVDAFAIDVDTVDGVVTLSGKVESAAQRDEAAELARGTDGVSEVVNRIEVGPRAD